MTGEAIDRVAIYSHDTFGLGHLTRSRRIARVVVDALPEAHVLLISGSPVIHRVELPPRVDCLKLPSVVKLGNEVYGSRELGLSGKEIRNLRRSVILAGVREFQPDLLMVDNVPLGMKSELRPTLRYLRRHRPRSRIHLNLRDILDAPDRLLDVWRKRGVGEVLREFYDQIDIFGERKIYDAIEAYDLPRDRTRFMGYLAPRFSRGADGALPSTPTSERSRILVTVGGGEDGDELLDALADALRSADPRPPHAYLIVTGPLMRQPKRQALRVKLEDCPDVAFHEFVPDLARSMQMADLVISMGGYNTLCEVMANANRSLVVPREEPRREQLIRAERLAERGVVRILRQGDLSANTLRDAIDAALAAPAWLTAAPLPSLAGARTLADQMRGLEGRSSARDRAASQAGGAVESDLEPAPPAGSGEISSSRAKNVGGLLASLILLLWFGAGVSAGAVELMPKQLDTSLEYGYDDNILHSSFEEVRAFNTGSSDAFFVVNSLEDNFFDLRTEGDWLLGRPWNSKTELGLGFRRRQYVTETIKNENAYSAALSTRPAAETRVSVEVVRIPWMYGRHRRDKVAAPGEPQFRPEVQDRWYLETVLRQRFGAGWQFEVGLEGLRQRYREPFCERDRDRLRPSVEGRWQTSYRSLFRLKLGYERAWSNNLTDVDKDLSHRQWEIRPRLRYSQLWGRTAVDIDLRLRFRKYLTQNPEDTSHFGRDDVLLNFRVTVSKKLAPDWMLLVGLDLQRRDAQLETGGEIALDEEGDSDRTVVTAGMAWSWEKD
jgi:predicted glycosyltransferase